MRILLGVVYLMMPTIFSEIPWSAEMPATPQLILTVICFLVWILAAWFVRSECRRRGDRLPLYAFIGAGLVIIYEPLGDVLANVLYPVNGQWTWIDLMGRPIPVFIGLLYFWYMSVPGLYFLKRQEEGLTKRELWMLYARSLALATAIELYGVNVDSWIYYGDHAYRVFGVPLWCPITYSGFLVSISAGLYLMATRLPRSHQWLVIFGLPAFMAGGHMVCALPASAALLTTNNPIWIWTGATASIGLSFLSLYVLGNALCTDGWGRRQPAMP
ncbi:MAG: hypothetical protein RIC38_05570 [Chromatocurvus sp.]